jgi:hypothetical protein
VCAAPVLPSSVNDKSVDQPETYSKKIGYDIFLLIYQTAFVASPQQYTLLCAWQPFTEAVRALACLGVCLLSPCKLRVLTHWSVGCGVLHGVLSGVVRGYSVE